MKISKTFYWGVDDYGMSDWIPEGIPGANIIQTEMTACHDLMEHCTDNGIVHLDSFANEICALGAVACVRNSLNIERTVRIELPENLRYFSEQSYPRAKQEFFDKIEAYESSYVLNTVNLRQAIREAVIEYVKDESTNHEVSKSMVLRSLGKDFVNNTLAWLICGYEHACDLYKDSPEYPHDLFARCEKAWRKFYENEGSEEYQWHNRTCKFVLDIANAKAWVEIEEPEYEPEENLED